MRQLIILLSIFITSSSYGQTKHAQHADSTRISQLPPHEFMLRNLPGVWKDQNSTITMREDSSYYLIFDRGGEQKGTWGLVNGKLYYKFRRSSAATNGFQMEEYSEVYNILEFKENRMLYQLENKKDDITIWDAKKISQPITKKYGSVENVIAFDKENVLVSEADSIASALTSINYFDAGSKKYIYLKKYANNFELYINCKRSIKKQPQAWEEVGLVRNEMQARFPKNKIIIYLVIGKVTDVFKKFE